MTKLTELDLAVLFVHLADGTDYLSMFSHIKDSDSQRHVCIFFVDLFSDLKHIK